MEEPAGSSSLLSDNSSDCSSAKSGFKMREGKITRNGFLNFLRCYRKSCCAKNVVEVACEGAKIWNRMSDKEKAPYIKAACKAPRRPSGCRSKSRRRRKSKRCGSSCGRKRKRSSCSRRRKRSSCSKRRRRSSCGLPKRKRRRSSCKRKRRPACRPKRKRSRCGKKRKKIPACLCPPKRKKKSCRKICWKYLKTLFSSIISNDRTYNFPSCVEDL